MVRNEGINSRKDGKGFDWYRHAIKNTKKYKMRKNSFKEKVLKKSLQLTCKNDGFVRKDVKVGRCWFDL